VSRAPLRELDLAALRQDLPALGLIGGGGGPISLVHGDGAGHAAGFMSPEGPTVAVETLTADQVEPVTGQRILHARKLAPA